MKPTPKQKRFAAEYLIDLDATKAAIRAGYSKKTAGSQAHDLLKKPEIAELVAKGQASRLNKLEITAETVLAEIAKLAFANMDDYIIRGEDGSARIDLSKLTRDQVAAIQEIIVDETGGGAGDGVRAPVQRTRFKLADKGLNLERLGRHLKLFTEKVEVSGKVEISELIRGVRERKLEYERSGR